MEQSIVGRSSDGGERSRGAVERSWSGGAVERSRGAVSWSGGLVERSSGLVERSSGLVERSRGIRILRTKGCPLGPCPAEPSGDGGSGRAGGPWSGPGVSMFLELRGVR